MGIPKKRKITLPVPVYPIFDQMVLIKKEQETIPAV